MVQYFCDRCGRKREKYELFAVTITPPEVRSYNSSLGIYYDGDLHFCDDCMKKINDCIEELGRKDD